MKIGIHMNQYDGRGSSRAAIDYANGLQSILNYDPIFITSNRTDIKIINKLKSQFETITYDKKPIHEQSQSEIVETNTILSNIVNDAKLDFLHMIKSGANDNVTPDNIRTGIHCVFTMDQPHGTKYAGVSRWIANKYNQPLYVPHIIKNIQPTKNLRKELNIPKESLIVFRHGGMDMFNIAFSHEAIKIVLEHRKDIYFVFLSTTKFIEHERVIFIDWVESDIDKFNLIHTADVYLHGRLGGESFGLAVGEASIANKPVITWSGINDIWPHDKNHIEVLGNKAIIYNDLQELVDILYSIDKPFIQSQNWDMYSKDYNESTVINKFKEVFLET